MSRGIRLWAVINLTLTKFVLKFIDLTNNSISRINIYQLQHYTNQSIMYIENLLIWWLFTSRVNGNWIWLGWCQFNNFLHGIFSCIKYAEPSILNIIMIFKLPLLEKLNQKLWFFCYNDSIVLFIIYNKNASHCR